MPFARGALMRIFAYSRGIPRVINLVCDRALMAAFSARAREVGPALVKAAIRNLEGERSRRRPARALTRQFTIAKLGRVAAVVAGLLLVGAAAAAAYRSGWNPSMLHLRAGGGAAAPAARPAPVSAAAATPKTTPAAALQQPGPAVLTAGNHDGLSDLVARVLPLWGVNEDLSERITRAWPRASDGALDVPAIAARYQLAATRLPETDLDELRAVNLPAILEMNGQPSARVKLLARLDGATATMISPDGGESRVPVDELDASWGHSAWVIWRNVDLLPVNPALDLTPIVVATLGLRLQKLGLLNPPIPTSNSDRFQAAVRRFQSSVGLEPDGIIGPRTTLALSRIVAGRFGPTLAGGAMSSR